jgi:flagellar protein FliJ
MNRFSFRLDSVLRVRAAEETKKKREFGAARQLAKIAEDAYRAILYEIEVKDRLVEEKGTGSTTAAELMALGDYALGLEAKKVANKKTLEHAEEALDRKREELVEATRRRKTLERLREKALLEYQRLARNEEQAIIDDTAVQKYSRSISKEKSPA